MRVGLDATPLTVPTGGIPRYVRSLAGALAREFPEDRIVLYSDQDFPLPDGRERGTGPAGWWQRRWWLNGLASSVRRDGVEVFHGTDFAIPYRSPVPAVLTLHDLSPWRDRDWHVAAGRVRRRTPRILKWCRWSYVLTPTEAVRQEAVERFTLPPDRVVAIPHGADPVFRPSPKHQPPPPAPYFLYAGTIEPRKNIPVLIEAWRDVRTRHPVELVIAGSPRQDAPRLPDLPGLRVLGPVPDEELCRLYQQAVAFLFPSHYEGFGLPVLEAMQCGAPVFISQDPALVEIAGDAGIILPADAPAEWIRAMEAALTRPGWREVRCQDSLERAQWFNWARTARLTREVYEEAVRRDG